MNTNLALQLITTETFNSIPYDFYKNENKEYFLTRKQIGTALEYSDPQKAIDKIHTRYPDRLNKFSVTTKLVGTDGKAYDTIVYSHKGIYEICRWSRQPKADAFMDWVWDVLEKLRKNEMQSSNNQINSEFKDILASLTESNEQTLQLTSQVMNLSNSVIDLTKYIQQKESQQLHTPDTNKKNAEKTTQKPKNNVYEITDKYYEDLRKLAETETGYIGDVYVDKIKKLFDKLTGKRISMIFNISDEIVFEKFDYEFHEAVDYGTAKSFAYFVMKCAKTRTRKRIFVCDIREINGQRIYLMDSSKAYKFRVKRAQG